MKLSRSRAWLLSFSALAGVMAVGAPAFAADAPAPAPAPAAQTSSSKVDEVVVTGTLRSQRLQEAPLAVSAVKPEEFINAGFKEPRELQFLSPSIQVSIQGANAIYIRGSGTNSQNGGTEQSVGMVIDGVLMGFVDDIGGDISDLDHIEVYRGPQGTQFAKNASAGVISVMTKKPQLGDFGGTVHASYGEHNDTSDDATINIPINDDMAARMSASFQHRDGVFPNLALHENQGGREQKGAEVQVPVVAQGSRPGLLQRRRAPAVRQAELPAGLGPVRHRLADLRHLCQPELQRPGRRRQERDLRQPGDRRRQDDRPLQQRPFGGNHPVADQPPDRRKG